jgi:hypothetical protein
MNVISFFLHQARHMHNVVAKPIQLHIRQMTRVSDSLIERFCELFLGKLGLQPKLKHAEAERLEKLLQFALAQI